MGSKVGDQVLTKYILLFFAGGSAYALLEVVWRGYTHWTMFIAGGICTILLNMISSFEMPLWERAVIGGAVITAVELAAGSVVNLALGWDVWDYSRMPMNLWGQVWIGASLGWTALSVPVMGLCSIMERVIGW